ncbi:helix-turn-helix transcriptional regulator [Gluconacetobacter azotocaptans]|uniref:Helix-turn-helix transcriptional regulator n=1 Tax=Gluconacetobacter azotocaptans TaxID=142834 RepID=A0A7W4JU98_9PROT|nr:helix-turn-helix transcriptional regulator [Gluconacetobacter azotocaptans]MBB2190957.1 helix-turn-helix transcriptional regulator [Gluconacetobacter azotocaptans]MBM9401686.1 helix-turn-helix transcriptional regulator [Gluconacetobacter azotocaptans]GBQ31853.1 LuxR family transcriptional regulator [Gluconacetobacter azotocaptans DSM 13594]
MSDIEFISDDEMKRHPFYQDFLRKFDRGRTCRFGFAEPSAPEFVFAVQRALNAEPETPDERRVRGILARHISRSLSLSAEIGKTRLLAEGFADLCHRLQCGAALLNGDGGVVLINQKLRGMLGDGVDYLNGRIISGNRDNQNRLDALLKATACGEVQSAHKGFIVLNCPSGQNLIVRAVRLPRESMFHVHEARQSAMLILAYKTGSRETDVSAALRPLGLTAAEIRLAQKIGSGVSPKDAAKSLGISDQYARSLLKVVFRKLNIASQSQLSTLVSGLSGLGDA